MKVLVDAMYDGMEERLRKLGFEAYSVRKLQKQEEKLGHDFNVLSHASKNGMTLVTADKENGRACRANNFSCIFVDEESIFEKVILAGLRELDNPVV